jgi:hypothetical protein
MDVNETTPTAPVEFDEEAEVLHPPQTKMAFDFRRGGHTFGPVEELHCTCASCGLQVSLIALTDPPNEGRYKIPDCTNTPSPVPDYSANTTIDDPAIRPIVAAALGVNPATSLDIQALTDRIDSLEKRLAELAAKEHLAQVVRELKVDVIKVVEAGPQATVVFLINKANNPAEIHPGILENLKRAMNVRNVFFATDIEDIKVVDQPLIQTPNLVLGPTGGGRRP